MTVKMLEENGAAYGRKPTRNTFDNETSICESTKKIFFSKCYKTLECESK